MMPARRQSTTSAIVPRLWPGSTIVCLGGGPSLTQADVDYCRGRDVHVIAVNDAYRLAPWADVLYACDSKWWGWHKGVRTFAGRKYSLQAASSIWPGVQVLKNTGESGLELAPTGLKTGRNSGYQAMNLAVHLGAARILLLGYDMRCGPGGQTHWFGRHPNQSEPPVALFLQRFPSIVAPLKALGIAVVNCSRETALTLWPCLPIDEALP